MLHPEGRRASYVPEFKDVVVAEHIGQSHVPLSIWMKTVSPAQRESCTDVQAVYMATDDLQHGRAAVAATRPPVHSRTSKMGSKP